MNIAPIVNENIDFIGLFCLTSFIGIRGAFNILIHNKIYQNIPKTSVFPIQITCVFIFWWKMKMNDKDEIKRYKKVGNLISIVSSIIFVTGLTLIIIYADR